MNAGRQLLRVGAPVLQKQGAKNLSSFDRIKELQKFFQKEDGVPIYLKRGTSDVIMFRFCVLSTTALTLNSFYNLYKFAFKIDK